MVQAASSGLIDFREMKFFNKPWQQKLRLLIRGLHQNNERQLKTFQQIHHTALLGISGISAESMQKVQTRCQDDLHELTNLLRPWAPITKEDKEKEQVRAQRDRWTNRWGDPDDPEVKRKIEETAEALRRRRTMNAPKTAEGDYFAIFNKSTAEAVEG